MGTRAIIKWNGEAIIATHWDGSPDSLGQDLSKMKYPSIKQIIKIAKEHSIDAVAGFLLDELNKERIAKIAREHSISEEEVKKGIRRGSIIRSSDYEIGNINNYNDWAEYEYDITNKDIKVTSLSGSYKTATRGETSILKTFSIIVPKHQKRLISFVRKSKRSWIGKGWHKESKRHALAAKGIKTKVKRYTLNIRR